MKKVFCVFIFISITISLFSQTLFTYGKYAVSKEEFLRAYNKNKNANEDKATALREYLDLYINFKLKLKAAQNLRIDTLPSLANDLQNFRIQIQESYLTDNTTLNRLVTEAFNRSQKDIHVGYMFFPLKDFKDSIAAVQHYRLSKSSWTDVGFITVFNLPYAFENIVYNLKPGEESNLYKTEKGYYAFKSFEERKAIGKIKVAQILIALPQGANEENKLSAKKIADSIHKALHVGADFTETAKNISNDKMTYMNGGLMPEFGVGKFDPVFEKQAFSLKKNGDITLPFLTSYGYHIIKRLDHTPVSTNSSDANTLYSLKQKIQQDERGEISKAEFLSTLLKKIPVKKYAVNYDALAKITDSFLVNFQYKIRAGNLHEKSILFSIATQIVTVKDWIKFVLEFKNNNPEKDRSQLMPAVLMQQFLATSVTDYYRKNLDKLNHDFKYQLQEFKDGSMLFEVMQKYIWDKAANDSVGLKNFYTHNKKKYSWNESADAVIISGTNEKTVLDALQQIKAGKNWRQIADENNSQLQADSGRFELVQLPVKQGIKITEGLITDPLINSNDGTAGFLKIIKIYPANQPRNFTDARGLVINDYQTYLEEKWIQQLKKKYPVKIDEKVFRSML